MATLNLNRICRTCKCVTPQMRSIFEGYENSRIEEMLMACTSIQVAYGDGLPAQICQICEEQLNNAFVFKTQCEKVEASLREYVENLKDKELQHSGLIGFHNAPNQQSSESQHKKSVIANVTPTIETNYRQYQDSNQTVLTCGECAKTFTIVEDLDCHACAHTDETYKCKQCHKSYKTVMYLKRHEQSNSCKKVYICRICNKKLTRREQLKSHLTTHLRKELYCCSTCNRGFNSIIFLQNHQPTCKGDIVYPCYMCNCIFDTEDSLAVHKTMHNNQQPKFVTVKDLDSVKHLYYEIYGDADMAVSDHLDVVDDCSNPQVKVMEEVDEKIVVSDEESNATDASLSCETDNDSTDSCLEKTVGDLMNAEQEDTKEVTVEEHPVVADTGSGDDNVSNVKNYEFLKTLNSLPNSQSSSISEYESIIADITATIEADYIQYQDNDQTVLTCGECGKTFTTVEDLDACTHRDEMYKCKHCYKSYKILTNLKRHEQSNDCRKIYVCKICNRRLIKVGDAKKHLMTHLRKKPYCCSTCNKEFNTAVFLQNHLLRCKGDAMYPCDICHRIYNREDSLAVHKKVHSNQQRKLLTIKDLENIKDYYHEINPDADVVSDHKDVDHRLEPQDTVIEGLEEDHEKEVQEIALNDEDGNPTAASLGGDASNAVEDYVDGTDFEYLKKVKVVQTKSDCDESPKNPDSSSKLTGGGSGEHQKRRKKRNHSNSTTKNILCSECGKRFFTNDCLVIHMRSHTGEKPYKCKHCRKGFSSSSSVQIHERLHTGEKKYLCAVCGKRFVRPSYLTCHMRTHTKEKRYQCTYCDAAYFNNCELKAHIRKHTGERFQCEICSKSFHVQHLVDKHKQKIHGIPSTSELTSRKRIHTRKKTHLCTICRRSFGRGYDLRQHMRTHTGEKPFQCTYCDAAYAQSNDLKVHIRRHTGERFQCEFCPEKFLLLYLFKRHKRTVHGK